jgi:hypothetical protein
VSLVWCGPAPSAAVRAALEARGPLTLVDPSAPGAAATLAAAERRVYVYGAGAEAATHPLALEHPGLVVLARRSLHAAFARMWRLGPLGPDRYVERMEAFYGSAAALLADRANARGGQLAHLHRYPLWEEALGGADAVLVYDDELAEEVRGHWPGPLQVAAPADAEAFATAVDTLLAEAEAWRPFLALADRAADELAALGVTWAFPVTARVARDVALFRGSA